MIWQDGGAETTAGEAPSGEVVDAAAAASGGEEAVIPLTELPDLSNREELIAYGINLAISIGKVVAILLIAWIIAGWVARIIRNRGEKSKRVDTTLAFFFSNLARWAILALGVITAIGVVGVPTASFAAVLIPIPSRRKASTESRSR